MARPNFNDLAAFAVVARHKSFTKAAAELGVTPSALSQTIRGLEERLSLQLLRRTTRSVSTTEAGERLLLAVAPRLEEIETTIGELSELREKPAGTVRITCSEFAAETAVWPRLFSLLPSYPDIKVEISIEQGFTNITAERFDAGVRLGESVEKDMIAVRIAPDDRLIVVAAPSYFERRGLPQTPHDLTAHTCINARLASSGVYAWEFAKEGTPLRVKVDGQFTFNTIRPMVEAAVAGLGIAFVPGRAAENHLQAGMLVQVLDEWCPLVSGFHLYYPSRRQHSPAFEVVLEALRYRV